MDGRIPILTIAPQGVDTSFEESARILPAVVVDGVISEIVDLAEFSLYGTGYRDHPSLHPLTAIWSATPVTAISYAMYLASTHGLNRQVIRDLARMQYLVVRSTPAGKGIPIPSWWGDRSVSAESGRIVAQFLDGWKTPDLGDSTGDTLSEIVKPTWYEPRGYDPEIGQEQCMCSVSHWRNVGSNTHRWMKCQHCDLSLYIWIRVTEGQVEHHFHGGPLDGTVTHRIYSDIIDNRKMDDGVLNHYEGPFLEDEDGLGMDECMVWRAS